ncbi:MAG: M3 family oligoendopeptidase [Patescibacteria group bacterium]
MKKLKIKTAWDLGLLYQDNDDPAIEADLVKAERAYDDFAKKYGGQKDYLTDESQLAAALSDYEQLEALAPAKPLLFFHYQTHLDSKNSAAEAKVNLLSQRLDKVTNKIIFFPLGLSKISKDKQAEYLKSEILIKWRYFLKVIFDHSQYLLSEPEEKLFNLLSLPAHALWVKGNEKNVSGQEVKWRGKTLPLAEALGKISALPTRDRRALHTATIEKLKGVADFAESELNAVVISKKISDELRGYANPYEATVLGYQNERATVDNLVATVTDNFAISHRFYRLKAKLLGLRRLTYADRSAAVGKTRQKISFGQAVEIIRRAFAKVSPIYTETFDEFLRRGQIDVFPKTGKHGGAYCSSYANLPTFILLNHLPDFRSVTTLAHELGHAFHSKFSFENQPPFYRDYTTAAAEVASTLFENFVFDEVFSTLSAKEKIVALHDKINGSVQTIFRQIACFNFEVALHTAIRARGALSKTEIAALMNAHMSAYLGPIFKLHPDDGYFFVYWSHLRQFFYVYSYAFGELVSNALYSRYQADKKFEVKIRQFLSAGGSASPENIFASIGLDVRHPEFFKLGLQKIEEDIAKLEDLV